MEVSANCIASMPHILRQVYLLLRIGLSEARLSRAKPARLTGQGLQTHRATSAKLSRTDKSILGTVPREHPIEQGAVKGLSSLREDEEAHRQPEQMPY